MSKILANQIANFGDNSPIELKEGLNIPAGKPLQINGSVGSPGQVLTTTGGTVTWTAPFSGNYADLTNKPVIPAAQVQSDWNATGNDVAAILNKPVIPAQPSITLTAPGSSTLTYNQANGEFTFTPPDLSAYLTSYSETDPIFLASPAYQITNQNRTEWGLAYSWGDHSQAGYLTSYTETDPVFAASPAGSITLQNKTNWDTAYGWGNHATQGYLTSYTETDPVFTASVAAGITLQNVSNWNTAYTWGDHGQAGYLTDLSSSSVDGLSDVAISGAVNGQFLQYNGTNWVNITPSFLTSYTETDTLASVTARGASTTDTITLSDLNVTGNLNVTGTTTTNNVSTLNVTNNEIVINENQASGGLNAVIRNERGTDADVSIRWNETTDRWQFTNNGTTYYDFAISASDLTNDAGYLTSSSSIDILGDVIISSPSNGDVLSYNGSDWVNSPASITAKAAISDAAPSNPSPGDMWWKSDEGTMKVWYDDGNTSQWVDASPVGDPFENVYASVAFFPGANVNEGAFSYSQATGAMYYSNSVSWTSQRVVTTNSSTTSDFSTLLANTQLTYSISALDYTTGGTAAYNNARKIVRLADSQGITSDIILTAGTGLSIIKSNNEITFNNDVTDTTYGISSEAGAGSNATFRLTDSEGVLDEITFAGADGLTVENTDANTITFRAPDITSQLYTDEEAQDAVAAMFANGTHTNITFTYDDANNAISATAQAGGGGGGGTTYDLVGSNTNSNNAIITLLDANNNQDNIEITASGGTTVNWDGANERITISSTAPVQPDWNASSGLAEILNKPTIPPAYTLPTAAAGTLGGIKVGANLSIDADGILSANAGGYTLPAADATTLGGIKVGSGLSIDGNGVLTATGGSSVPSIQDLSGTTAALAADGTSELNITGYKAYSLFKITTDAEAWVRVYVDDASRDADNTRSEGEDPTPGSGVISEVRTSGAESILISPGIMGFNNDNPRTNNIYLAVTNRSGASTTITVTLTALQIGE
jgi:hypothetical protein